MIGDYDDLSGDPDLGTSAAELREQWRLEEEEYIRAAEQHWAHRRTLLDVCRELMHRGDAVAVELVDTTFTGTMVAVGEDYFQLRTAAGAVDVRVTGTALVVRVVKRATAGGCHGEPASRTFRARLLEHEVAGNEVTVGSSAGGERLTGCVFVGRDQVQLRGHGADVYVPLSWIAWMRDEPR